jgi:hypothetical protein
MQHTPRNLVVLAVVEITVLLLEVLAQADKATLVEITQEHLLHTEEVVVVALVLWVLLAHPLLVVTVVLVLHLL